MFLFLSQIDDPTEVPVCESPIDMDENIDDIFEEARKAQTGRLDSIGSLGLSVSDLHLKGSQLVTNNREFAELRFHACTRKTARNSVIGTSVQLSSSQFDVVIPETLFFLVYLHIVCRSWLAITSVLN